MTKWSHLRRAVTGTIDKVVVWPAGFLVIHERLCNTFCGSSSHIPAHARDSVRFQALLHRALGHRRLLDRWVLPAIPTASFRRARTLFPSLRLDMLWPRRRPLVPGSGPPATMPWPPIGVAVVVVAPAVLGAAAAPPLHSRAAILLPLLLSCATTPADMPNARIGHLAGLTRPHQREARLRNHHEPSTRDMYVAKGDYPCNRCIPGLHFSPVKPALTFLGPKWLRRYTYIHI